jgi:hypothetical protein
MKVLRNTLLRAFLAVLVVAAVAAPTAFGSDLRSPDTQDAAKAPHWGRVSDRLVPDTQDAAKAAHWGRVSDRLLPDTQDAANGRRGAAPTIEVVTVAAPSGFDWIDAGIGVAFGLGVSLVAAGGLVLVLKRHRRPVAVA